MSTSHRRQESEPTAPLTSIQPVSWPIGEGQGRTLRTHDIRVSALAGDDAAAFIVCDFSGRILFANPKAAPVLGLASGTRLVGMHLDRLAQRFLVEDWEGTPTTRLAFPAMPAPDRVLRFRDPTVGWDRWTLIRTQACAESHGTVLAVLHLLQDVSQEQRTQEGVRLLAEAGRRLSRSLSRDRILEHAVVTAIPRLGDETIVVMRTEGGCFSPATWQIPGEHAAERAQALLRRCAPTLERLDAEPGPCLLRYDPETEGSSPGESILVLPVERDGRVVAALILAMATNTGRIHHPVDVALGEHFAELVASALANAARLEAEQQRHQSLERRAALACRDADRGATLLRIVERELDGLRRLAQDGAGEVAASQSQLLCSLATAVAELGRTSAGGTDLERSVVDLRQVLAEAVEGARPSLGRSNQEPRLEGDGPLFVFGDFRRLVRTFTSLLSTVAARAIAPGPITIGLAARGRSHVEVALRGEATTAPLVPLDEVLESFGTLSLAIDRQIIALHGGEIWAFSRDPHAGTAFTVQLPLLLSGA